MGTFNLVSKLVLITDRSNVLSPGFLSSLPLPLILFSVFYTHTAVHVYIMCVYNVVHAYTHGISTHTEMYTQSACTSTMYTHNAVYTEWCVLVQVTHDIEQVLLHNIKHDRKKHAYSYKHLSSLASTWSDLVMRCLPNVEQFPSQWEHSVLVPPDHTQSCDGQRLGRVSLGEDQSTLVRIPAACVICIV